LIEAQDIDPDHLAFDLIIFGLQPLAREHHIELEVRGNEARVAADRDKLRRAVENLISNAIKKLRSSLLIPLGSENLTS
jgi:signal transduction histidine kinase